MPTILPIMIHGQPVLREVTRPVEAFDDALRRLADDMVETMYAAPGVGLAGNQVGRSLRVFVWDAQDGTGPHAIANPVLSDAEGEQTHEEGCLSIPGLYQPCTRFARIRVEGVDLQGRPVAHEGEGLLARIFQHETDHLNGKLFIDRLAADERRKAMAAIREQDLSGSWVPDPQRAR